MQDQDELGRDSGITSPVWKRKSRASMCLLLGWVVLSDAWDGQEAEHK